MIIVFVTCIGFVQLFISLNAAGLSAKKIFLITLSAGLFLAAANYLIIQLVTPETMIHKKYSLSLGVLISAFYALTVYFVVQKRRITGLFISLISCLVYWALLVYGEKLSIKLGGNGIINAWFPTMLFAYLAISFFLVHKLFELHKANGKLNPEASQGHARPECADGDDPPSDLRHDRH